MLEPNPERKSQRCGKIAEHMCVGVMQVFCTFISLGSRCFVQRPQNSFNSAAMLYRSTHLWHGNQAEDASYRVPMSECACFNTPTSLILYVCGIFLFCSSSCVPLFVCSPMLVSKRPFKC